MSDQSSEPTWFKCCQVPTVEAVKKPIPAKISSADKRATAKARIAQSYKEAKESYRGYGALGSNLKEGIHSTAD
jgi:hypothetical protein